MPSTRRLLVWLSHPLTEDQLLDAQRSLGVAPNDIHRPPADLLARWASVPTDSDWSISEHLQPLLAWTRATARPGDFVLVQGHFGLTFALVDYCLRYELMPLYAATRRVSREETLPDGSVRTVRLFKHLNFQRYEKLDA